VIGRLAGGASMEYRSLGRTELTVSLIGLGTEHLTTRPRDDVLSVVQSALDRGVNYFDLVFALPAFREHVASALVGRRHEVIFAEHLGSIDVNGQPDRTLDGAEARGAFLKLLQRHQTDYADVLFIHDIDRQEDYDRAMGSGGLLEAAQRLQKEGLARAVGFSGHSVATASQAIETGAVDVLMFPINLSGHSVAGKRTLFEACASRGVGLVGMKPFAGGKLLAPERTMAMGVWQRGGTPLKLERRVAITPVQCLAYALSQPGICTVVAGCTAAGEVAGALRVLTASAEERDFADVLSDFAQFVPGECVYCNHCLPCPVGIDIGRTISLLDRARGRPTAEHLAAYSLLPSQASLCIECFACNERCPFGVDAAARVLEAAAVFGVAGASEVG
jgi:uncharacterized protein